MNYRHRNNAAEWIMWVCLLPVFAIATVWSKMKRNVHEGHEGTRRDAKKTGELN